MAGGRSVGRRDCSGGGGGGVTGEVRVWGAKWGVGWGCITAGGGRACSHERTEQHSSNSCSAVWLQFGHMDRSLIVNAQSTAKVIKIRATSVWTLTCSCYRS